MDELGQNARDFLQARFPEALVLSYEQEMKNPETGIITKFVSHRAVDPASGIQQRAISIENLGFNGALVTVAEDLDLIFQYDNLIEIGLWKEPKPMGHKISTKQMPISPRLVLYTNKLCSPIEDVIDLFSHLNASVLIEVVDESEMHKSLFISYGGKDKAAAGILNNALKSKGVKTWFFPIDAPAGQKLHRVMYDGVNNHDRVLLVCSKSALSRPGVLNEIERILEREAKEGGSDILLPIALDDYVYKWKSDRPDIAEQVRSRVIVKFTVSKPKSLQFGVSKILAALKQR